MFAIQNTGHKLINRGDPDGADFDKTDFTTDGGVYELDLSSIVPLNAISVILHCQIQTTAPDYAKVISFRKKGNSYWLNKFTTSADVAGKDKYQQGLVFVGNDRIIEYQSSNYTFYQLDLTVLGWWIK